MWGTNYEANVKAAQQLVREMDTKRPGLLQLLEETGAGNSAYVVAQISLHAQRLASRQG